MLDINNFQGLPTSEVLCTRSICMLIKAPIKVGGNAGVIAIIASFDHVNKPIHRDLCMRGSFREGKAKRGEKAQFTRVNEYFESVFNAAIAGNGLVQRSLIIEPID